MIVAISNGQIVAHADLVSDCKAIVEKLDQVRRFDWTRYRPASPALAKLIESGADLESIRLSITDVADLA